MEMEHKHASNLRTKYMCQFQYEMKKDETYKRMTTRGFIANLGSGRKMETKFCSDSKQININFFLYFIQLLIKFSTSHCMIQIQKSHAQLIIFRKSMFFILCTVVKVEDVNENCQYFERNLHKKGISQFVTYTSHVNGLHTLDMHEKQNFIGNVHHIFIFGLKKCSRFNHLRMKKLVPASQKVSINTRKGVPSTLNQVWKGVIVSISFTACKLHTYLRRR